MRNVCVCKAITLPVVWMVLEPCVTFCWRIQNYAYATYCTFLHEIRGSRGDYYHVVEVLGFGTVCTCRSMPTFRRNMLSPSSHGCITQDYNNIHVGLHVHTHIHRGIFCDGTRRNAVQEVLSHRTQTGTAFRNVFWHRYN
jgi:hypothetical protein